MTDFQGQAAVVQQANLDFFFGLVSKMLEGGERLIKLNLDTAKTTFADWYQRIQDGLTKKDGQDVPGLQNSLLLPSADKVLTYERQVAEIASTMQTQLAEVVDTQYQQANRQVEWFIENVAQNAPVSSEAAIALLKQIITVANTARDSMHKAAKQTVDFAQSSVSATMETASEVVESADQTAEKTAKPAKQ